MAATAIALQFRSKQSSIRNPSFLHFFSSSSSTSDSNVEDQTTTTSTSQSPPPPPPPPPPQSQSSISSYFSDVKASLKQQSPPQQQQRQLRQPFSPSSQTPSKVASLEEIRKNLSEFRRRYPALEDRSSPPASRPPPSSTPPKQHVSFQELYKRNVASKGEDSGAGVGKGRGLSFEDIRASMRELKSKNAKSQVRSDGPMSLGKFKESFRLQPVDPNARDSRAVIGGTDSFPGSMFAKERKEGGEPPAMKTEFLKTYDYGELGTKLKMLRPEAKGENWFSLEELNERLVKLREMEEKETESRIGGTYRDLRESLMKLRISDDEKTKRKTIQRIDLLGQLGGTPNFMLSPPKDELVEKYFHPDNMSSAEKMKVELQKVREEFKMSESDCGSARVQVAQLTTKIKHLSTALHKKDKHSRKGLQGMVQRRKKLLTYLRRTDWDSYCLVLSKLGLRDNPDYKN